MTLVAYLTDVEGMWSRLASFTEANPWVRLDGEELVLDPQATLVFGGDAIDRGPDGRRLVAALLRAKRQYGARVVLLAGNRDINKLRLRRELAGHPPERTPEAVRRGPRPDLLRWILENSMGAKQAFAFRSAELAAAGAPHDDEDVVASFLDDVLPGGDLAEYLAAAQLAHRAGATLFGHGGLTEESLGAVPGRPRVDDVDAWVEALNGWYRGQVATYYAGEQDAGGRPAWQPLIAYQAPVPGLRMNPRSVVYGRTADEHNNPQLPPPAVVEALARAGVRRVVVGHTPNGDCPSVLRDRRFELICADNSHARHPGAAKVILTDESLEVDGQVILDDGRQAAVRFRLGPESDDSPIGARIAESGHLVKGRLADGDYLLFRYCPGYRCEQIAAPEAEVRACRLVPPY